MKVISRMILGLAGFIGFILLYHLWAKGTWISWIYADLFSLAGLIVLTAIINRINYSFKEEWNFFSSALKSGDSMSDPSHYRSGVVFFSHLQRIIYSVAAFLCIWAVISMMANLEDSASVGPNMATSLLVLLYAVMINLLLIHPCKMEMEKKLLHMEN